LEPLERQEQAAKVLLDDVGAEPELGGCLLHERRALLRLVQVERVDVHRLTTPHQ
jgi:hypothetical protein